MTRYRAQSSRTRTRSRLRAHERSRLPTVTLVTQAPWRLTSAHHTRALAAGLGDAEVLHAIALSAFFGHLNRMADAVDIALDYKVVIAPPAVDLEQAAMAVAPRARVGRPALELRVAPRDREGARGVACLRVRARCAAVAETPHVDRPLGRTLAWRRDDLVAG